MKPTLTSREIEARFRKARTPIVVEISDELTVQARAAHIQAFMSEVKRCNGRKTLMLVAIDC